MDVYAFGRSYAVTRLPSSNLLLVLVDSAHTCAAECEAKTGSPLQFRPIENILCTYYKPNSITLASSNQLV